VPELQQRLTGPARRCQTWTLSRPATWVSPFSAHGLCRMPFEAYRFCPASTDLESLRSGSRPGRSSLPTRLAWTRLPPVVKTSRFSHHFESLDSEKSPDFSVCLCPPGRWLGASSSASSRSSGRSRPEGFDLVVKTSRFSSHLESLDSEKSPDFSDSRSPLGFGLELPAPRASRSSQLPLRCRA